MDEPTREEFSRQAEEKAPGIVREFSAFLVHSKKWWLVPIVVSLLLLAALLIFGGTAAAPWIYTLF